MLAALLRRSLVRARGLLIPLTAVLVTFQLLLVVAASYFQQTQGFAQIAALLPVALQQMMGAAVFASFAGMVAFGFFHPVVIITFVGAAIFVASEPAAEVESGVVDLVLARPVARALLITRSIVMTAAATIVMGALMVVASRLAIAWMAPAGAAALPLRVLLKLVANLTALAWAIGALSLAGAAIADRRATAAGTAGILALALYLLNFLAEVWPRLRPYGRVSPFHYYQPMTLVSGTSARWSSDVAVLTATAAVLSLAAYVVFSRRDV